MIASTIDWSLVVQVVIACASLGAAFAAWRAANASRDVVRDQRSLSRIVELQELHGVLLNFQSIIANDTHAISVETYETGRGNLGRHLALLAGDVPAATIIFASEAGGPTGPPTLDRALGAVIAPADVVALREVTKTALSEVEALLLREEAKTSRS